MDILLIDNYDSFTYNLVHYLAELGANVEVVRNDAISIAEIKARTPRGIVISPGPGEPHNAGICPAVIKELGEAIPIFGVCLGHQAIGEVFGGKVVRNAPMHGKTSQIYHDGVGIFAGIKSPFTATRYHSLIVEAASLPDCLQVTAHTDDGIIMGLQHRHLPIHGVQFHPESIASEHGHDLLNNFLTIAKSL
jgi:anthranilate synthase component 2